MSTKTQTPAPGASAQLPRFDLAALLNRAAAAIETPADLSADERRHVVEDLNAEADKLDPVEASAHTPGPWRWSNRYPTMDGRETWSLLGDKHGYGILLCDGEANSPQSLNDPQNAALIAQAPTLATDLADALEREAKLKQIADELAEAAWGHDEAFCIIEDSAQEAARSNLEAKLMAYREFRAALGVQT